MQTINKIVLIEDNPADALLLQEALSGISFSQLINLSRLSDLDTVQGTTPELIFLDLNLPDGRGMESFIRVNKKFPTSAIIVLSGLEDQRMALQTLQAGAQDYIVKGDFDQKDLHKSIRFSIERKRSQVKLAESEEQYRVLLQSAPEAQVVLDLQQNRFVNASESALTMFRMTRDELLSKSVRDISPEFQPGGVRSEVAAREKLEDAVAGGTPHFEWDHMDSQGKIIPCEVWLVRIPSANRVLIRGSMVDISERKKAEEEIRSLEETRRLIMHSALDAIIGMDPEGRINIWTPRAEQLFGWKEAEVMGKLVAETIVPPEFREAHLRGLQRYLETREPVILNKLIEITAVDRSGRRFPIELTVSPIRTRESFFFCSFIRDISDRKQAEDLLRQSSERLRELSAHLQTVREEERIRIAREIHDELGQQLTVMKMDISWLKRKIDITDPKVERKMNDLMNVIDATVRTVRKISSDLRPSLLDDLGLVAALEWHSQEFEARSGIKTTFISAVPEVRVETATATAMYRIFQETLTNVARHADAKNVEATLQEENGKLVMRVRDDGRGFSKSEIDDKRTLGILGMQERAAIIDGEYRIESQPGEGTIVEVKVPIGH